MIEKVARIAKKWGLRKTRPASSVGQDARPGDRVQADMGRRCMVVDADPQGSLDAGLVVQNARGAGSTVSSPLPWQGWSTAGPSR
jgi:hypothetical protein